MATALKFWPLLSLAYSDRGDPGIEPCDVRIPFTLLPCSFSVPSHGQKKAKNAHIMNILGTLLIAQLRRPVTLMNHTSLLLLAKNSLLSFKGAIIALEKNFSKVRKISRIIDVQILCWIFLTGVLNP